MELFDKIFFILTTGIFLLLFMLLIEHPKRWFIGVGIFVILIIITFLSIQIMTNIPLLSPLLILLDAKRLSWKTVLIHLTVFIIISVLWSTLIFVFIPFYCYPILLFIYVIITKSSTKKHLIDSSKLDHKSID